MKNIVDDAKSCPWCGNQTISLISVPKKNGFEKYLQCGKCLSFCGSGKIIVPYTAGIAEISAANEYILNQWNKRNGD